MTFWKCQLIPKIIFKSCKQHVYSMILIISLKYLLLAVGHNTIANQALNRFLSQY